MADTESPKKPRETASGKKFLQFYIPVELFSRLDDWRFENRMESRAATINWLLEWALNKKPRRTKP